MTPNMMCTRGKSPQITVDWVRDMSENCAELQKNGGRMDTFMEAAREICRQDGVAVCDCYSDWKAMEAAGADITYLLSNHVNHPRRELHDLFAARLLETLLFQK